MRSNESGKIIKKYKEINKNEIIEIKQKFIIKIIIEDRGIPRTLDR